MEIDLPEIVAEVRAAFERYEAALCANDLATMEELFWNDGRTMRYGPNGTLLGHAAIAEFRRNRNITGLTRTLVNTRITTFGRDFAVANTEADLGRPDLVAQQTQTWVRMPQGWRIVSAHVAEFTK